MSNSMQDASTVEQLKAADIPVEPPVSADKGKGKRAVEEVDMDEDEDSSDEEQVSEKVA